MCLSTPAPAVLTRGTPSLPSVPALAISIPALSVLGSLASQLQPSSYHRECKHLEAAILNTSVSRLECHQPHPSLTAPFPAVSKRGPSYPSQRQPFPSCLSASACTSCPAPELSRCQRQRQLLPSRVSTNGSTSHSSRLSCLPTVSTPAPASATSHQPPRSVPHKLQQLS